MATLARTDDGSVQITMVIPWGEIEKEKAHVVEELGGKITVPGFRKGKAPASKVERQIPKEELIEHTLSHLLPRLVSDAIKEHKLTIAIYPKFELLNAKEGEDWQVRATTAEIPDINLGDYKKKISGELAAISIKKEPERAEKEQKAIDTLIDSIDAQVPKIIVEEEVNARLSQLLQRIEKLGLTLESYLASIGKTADKLREEYLAQATRSLKLDFILEKIGETEKVEVPESEVEKFINETKIPDGHAQLPGIRSALRKKKVIDSLVSL